MHIFSIARWKQLAKRVIRTVSITHRVDWLSAGSLCNRASNISNRHILAAFTFFDYLFQAIIVSCRHKRVFNHILILRRIKINRWVNLNFRHFIAIIYIKFDCQIHIFIFFRKNKIKGAKAVIILIYRVGIYRKNHFFSRTWNCRFHHSSCRVFISFSITLELKLDFLFFICRVFRLDTDTNTVNQFAECLHPWEHIQQFFINISWCKFYLIF